MHDLIVITLAVASTRFYMWAKQFVKMPHQENCKFCNFSFKCSDKTILLTVMRDHMQKFHKEIKDDTQQ